MGTQQWLGALQYRRLDQQRQLGYTPAPHPVVQTQARTYTPTPTDTSTYSAPAWRGGDSSYGSSGMTHEELQDRVGELEEQLQDMEQRVQDMEDERDERTSDGEGGPARPIRQRLC